MYYSGFALRSLMILGVLDGAPAERASDILRSRLDKRESIIDLISLVFGLFIGSFLNVVIHRVPRQESLVRPRSRCPACRC